ncbi:hypothetical protein [Streptomyces sp. NPDC058657]|uniref:hypothetical protein n=1 Tax=unclassified Streptomyces TaxID=2593676 RepID=UPI0036489D2D
MDIPRKQHRWSEVTTRVEWEGAMRPTTYDGGEWSTQEKITVTVTRCGSAETKPKGDAA